MKRVSLLLAALLCLALVGCTGEAGNGSTQDIIGRYANQIEDSKEELEEGLGKLQDAVDEVMKDVPSK